jgi:hypothetical protein
MNKHEAERQVDRWVVDAAEDRRRGSEETEADMLKAKLIEALTDPVPSSIHAVRNK